MKLSNCHLEVGNGNEYPEIHYTPSTDMTRVYWGVLKYVHKNNEYGKGKLLIRLNLFYSFFYNYIFKGKGKPSKKAGCILLDKEDFHRCEFFKECDD